MKEQLGFIGLGAIGAPVARNLVGNGHLFVYDISKAAMDGLVAAGAQPALDVKAIADACEIVFLCLPSLEVAQEVIFGPGGIIKGTKVRLVVDLSTTGASFACETARRLADQGVTFVSAPISGGVPRAHDGDLTVMAAGDPSAVARLTPYFASFASKIFNLGAAPGLGQTMKLLNNMLASTAFVASCQAMVAGVKAGLDPDMMIEVINSSTGRNNATTGKIPKAILPRTFDFGATINVSTKDADLCLKETDALGVSLTVAKAVRKVWDVAIEAGAGDKDNTFIITFLEQENGVEVKGKAAAGPC